MNNHIETEERKYFTIVPNIVDDIGLDPYAFRLYVHIRRVAGENGACWQSTETLAEICQMSTGRISKAKRTLQDAGLIRIETRTDNRKKYHHITVIDIWLKNITAYSPSEEARSPDELPSSPSEQHRSPGELKKNPIKNNHNEEESAADAASGDPPPEPSPEPTKKRQGKPTPEAVKVFRSNTHRYPPKAWYEAVATVVGDDPGDLEFWGEVCHEWVGKGWNPMNVSGMLDCYSKGGIRDPTNNNRSNVSRNLSALDEWLEETTNGEP